MDMTHFPQVPLKAVCRDLRLNDAETFAFGIATLKVSMAA
jgi:hypothetical protein